MESTPLSRKAIVEAALRIIDADGLSALNMRRLATEVGTKPMSLYRHVQNKQAVLDEVADAVLRDIALPDGPVGDPLQVGLDALRHFRRALLEHPKAVPLFAATGVAAGSEQQYALMEAAVVAGQSAGMTRSEALRAYAIAISFVIGFVVRELTSPLSVAVDASSDPEWLQGIRDRRTSFPELNAALDELSGPIDLDGLFEDGLAALAVGLVQAEPLGARR